MRILLFWTVRFSDNQASSNVSCRSTPAYYRNLILYFHVYRVRTKVATTGNCPVKTGSERLVQPSCHGLNGKRPPACGQRSFQTGPRTSTIACPQVKWHENVIARLLSNVASAGQAAFQGRAHRYSPGVVLSSL